MSSYCNNIFLPRLIQQQFNLHYAIKVDICKYYKNVFGEECIAEIYHIFAY